MDVAALAFAKHYLREYWQHERVVLKKQGQLLSLFYQKNSTVKYKRGLRGEIRDFSREARLRLLKFVATVNWGILPKGIFLTFTYPDDCWDSTMEQRTQHRSQLVRDMENFLGKKIYGFWRIEYKARRSGRCKGQVVQHWHFLWMNVGYIPYRYLRLRWEKIIGTKQHTQIKGRRVEGAKQASLYVSKYVAKLHANGILDNPSYLNTRGRHYGYFRKQEIPRFPCEWYSGLTDKQIEFCVLSAAARLPWVNPKDPLSFTVIGKIADEIFAEMLGIGLTNDTSDRYNYRYQGGAGAGKEEPKARGIFQPALLF